MLAFVKKLIVASFLCAPFLAFGQSYTTTPNIGLQIPVFGPEDQRLILSFDMNLLDSQIHALAGAGVSAGGVSGEFQWNQGGEFAGSLRAIWNNSNATVCLGLLSDDCDTAIEVADGIGDGSDLIIGGGQKGPPTYIGADSQGAGSAAIQHFWSGGTISTPSAGGPISDDAYYGFDGTDWIETLAVQIEEDGTIISGVTPAAYTITGQTQTNFLPIWTDATKMYNGLAVEVDDEGSAVGSSLIWVTYQNIPTFSVAPNGDTISAGIESAVSYATNFICVSATSPANCGVAPAGVVQMPTGQTTLVIQSSAFTANTGCWFTYDTEGTAPSNVASLGIIRIAARTPGTSITIALPTAPATNPVSIQFGCIN